MNFKLRNAMDTMQLHFCAPEGHFAINLYYKQLNIAAYMTNCTLKIHCS